MEPWIKRARGTGSSLSKDEHGGGVGAQRATRVSLCCSAVSCSASSALGGRNTDNPFQEENAKQKTTNRAGIKLHNNLGGVCMYDVCMYLRYSILLFYKLKYIVFQL